MTYKIENRYGEFFAITDKKYNDQIITVNLSNIILTDIVTVLKTMPIKEDFIWTLYYKEDTCKLYMKLITEQMTFQRKIDLDKMINELIDCVEHNKTLNNCMYINKIINDLYNDAFRYFFNDGIIILSNHIIKEIAYVNNVNNKTIGCASRFILTSTTCYLLEYEGKMKEAEDFKCIEIIINNKRIEFLKSKVEESFFSLIGYYKISGLLGQINKIDSSEKKEVVNIDEIVKLKVKPTLISLTNMREYVLEVNSMEDVMAYKKSMRPSVVMININKYMLNEFMI